MAQNSNIGGERKKSIPSIDDLMAVVMELENKMQDGIERTIHLEKEMRARTEERDSFKFLSHRLEKENEELRGKVKLNVTESQEVNVMKEKSEEILTRAKSIIFEKTKVCKNQELQIEALAQQVLSLKEVVSITKDLLQIRNMEVKHLQDQINIMSEKVEAEKERQNIIHAKLEKMISLNSELKEEYQTQLCLFNSLRQRYSENSFAKGNVKAAEPNIPENNEGTPETYPEENGFTEIAQINIAEPKVNNDTEKLISSEQHYEPSTDPSTADTSDIDESVGLSTIEENSSSDPQS